MTPLTMLTGLLLLALSLAVSITAKTCLSESISTEDYVIACSDWEKIELTCRSDKAWSSFSANSHGMLNATVDSLIFRNCTFPEDVSLAKVTQALVKLWDPQKLELQFVESRSWFSKQSLGGFKRLNKLGINRSLVGLGNAELLYDLTLNEMRIEETDLKRIPENFFKKFYKAPPGMTYLYIINNKLDKIGTNDFAGLSDLRELYLVNNSIGEFESGALGPLVSLQILDISENQLRTLPPDTFKNNARLERFRISFNPLDSLPAELLRVEDSRLQRFTMKSSNGTLRTLPPGFFKNLKRLSTVSIVQSHLTSLPSDLFDSAYSLTILDLSNNSLVTLPAGIFQTTSNLKQLNLRLNKLDSLPDNVFDGTSLEELLLDHNRLRNLSTEVFNGLNDLLTLDMSFNNLIEIGSDLCPRRTRSLQNIDLSYNQLTLENSDSMSKFVNCGHITHMNLAYNNISMIFWDWKLNKGLKYLNLNGNQVKSINSNDLFELLNTDSALYLESNPLNTIDLTGFEKMVVNDRKTNPNVNSRNASVHLGNNTLNCDCKFIELSRYYEKRMDAGVYEEYQIFDNGARCVSPSRFSNVQLVQLNSSDLSCMTKSYVTSDACYETCTCWDYPGKGALSIDCSNRSLTSVPSSIGNPHNWAVELNLSGNKLRETPSLNRPDLLKVTTLDLSRNNISSVSEDVFSRSLRSLELHNNSIARLSDQVLNYLSNENLLTQLTLHENKWICDCGARQLLTVYQKKISKLGLRELVCADTRQKLSAVTVNELCQGPLMIVIVGCVLVGFVGLVIGCLVALYYRYQQEIKIWLYSKQWCLWFVTEDELDKDKQYDAFISFSHKDEDFVSNDIVATLESGPRPYKLCVHYRDWLAGEWIPAQIARSVEESRRTIVVLSPNFIESVWGRMEFRTAHNQALSEGRARVIVVLYGEIGDTEELDAELKAYLSMNTYVKWGDPWFWDKLRYALPHKYEPSRPRARNTHIVENHLNQLPMSNRNGTALSQVVAVPNSTASSTDSDRLLERENGTAATC